MAVRLLTADTHPDHDTLCTFRRENKPLFTASFVQVLELAQELKLAQFGQITVSADGTKMAANASKHSAVSYAHAGKAIEQLELEVEQLLAKAEQADATPLQDGLSIPDEIVRRQERKAALEKKPDPVAPPPEASLAEKRRHRLQTAEGKAVYKLRQQTVEPGFGMIKSAMGFRPFLLRGLSKVSTEWTLVCLAYNVRRLHTLDFARNGVAMA